MSKSVPYASATSGAQAREQVSHLLQRFGCTEVGFLDEFATHAVLLHFKYRGRAIQLRATAQGWANMYLREEPWNHRRRHTEAEWGRRALDQGMVAVNSILRDWVKGELTAIESGIFTFDHAFLPHMLTPSGETVAEIAFDPARGLLSAPNEGP